MMKRILTSAVAVLFLLGGCAVAPTEAPPVAVAETPTVAPTVTATPAVEPLADTQEKVEPVPVEPVPVPVEPVPVVPPAAPPVALGGYELIAALQAQYGVYAHPATRFVVGPCHTGAHACVTQDIYTATGAAVGQNITLYIAPDQITPYLLFHEIAHTHGIMDECGADQYARSVVGPVAGYYC